MKAFVKKIEIEHRIKRNDPVAEVTFMYPIVGTDILGEKDVMETVMLLPLAKAKELSVGQEVEIVIK